MGKKRNSRGDELKRLMSRIDKAYLSFIQSAIDRYGSVLPSEGELFFEFTRTTDGADFINRLRRRFANELNSEINLSVIAEWSSANKAMDNLVMTVLDGSRRRNEKRYFDHHEEALNAFRFRKEKGLGLSDRVWNLSGQLADELEMALDIGIGDGLSADDLSRAVREYLRNPHELFRRVRDKHGDLKLSKHAKAYHPGRGVYRSSYKNARRLAATEITMAYRRAEHERIQDLDFVVGIEVHLSNNHTLNGVPFHDICDELKGKYPKDFVFTGWHPHCRCYATTILKSDEELSADEKTIQKGGNPTADSANAVENLPDNFNRWYEDNIDRIDSAEERGTLPYFLRDNKRWTNKIDKVIDK